MASRAGHRRGHRRLENRIDLLVGLVQCKELDVSFVDVPRSDCQKPGGNDRLGLFLIAFCGNQIASDLFDEKSVEGFILPECIDHPVAVSPSLIVRNIHIASGGLGVAGHVEPMPCPLNGKCFALEELVDDLLDGFLARKPLFQVF